MKKMLFLLVSLLFTFQIQAKPYPNASFKSPRDTMNYFLKTMKGYKTGDLTAINLAIKALNLSKIPNEEKDNTGKLAAISLIQSLDRLEYINISKIPDYKNGKTWVYKQSIITLNKKNHEIEIAISKTSDNTWKFTPKTISSVYYLYSSLKNKDVVAGVIGLNSFKQKIKSYFPKWTGNKSFILLNGQWLALLFLALLCFIIERLIKVYVTSLITKFLSSKSVIFEAKKNKKFTGPLGIMAIAAVWLVGIKFLEFDLQLYSIFSRVGIVAFTVGTVLTAHNFVDIICLYFEKLAKESENKFDDILVPLIRKTSKFFVIAVGFIFIGDSLTLNMKNILAGLGIGGIAFALAAKDTISNLFGSLTVLLDRPFSIGDWVVVNDKIEGTVEEVGLRSTRVRTFYDSIISIPNGTLTNAHIDNYGQRSYRRYNTKIGLQYDTTPEKIEAFCEGVRQIIKGHKFTRKDYFHVYLNGMNDSSLDILVYLFWKVPNWSSELQEKHRLLIDIIRLGNSLDVEFAFPTQTLHMYNEAQNPNKEYLDANKAFETAEMQAKQIIDKPISSKRHRSAEELLQNKELGQE
jgi:MscS family membrane protein